MPKGKAGIKPGFNPFRLKQSETINAMEMIGPFTHEGQSYVAGDFLIQNGDGTLTAARREEFLNDYEVVRATWSRTKKAKDESGDVAPQAEAAAEATTAVS